TSVMRFILFFAALGVVWHGVQLDAKNPAASVFGSAAGNLGMRFFGFVMWCAAITSVVGASYTSISFFRSLHPVIEKNYRIFITIFILTSTIVFIVVGNPVFLLVFAGALNGLILPIALAVILLAANKKRVVGNYKHPLWLKIAGWVVVVSMSWMGWISLKSFFS
ncbi:MAG TPA: divalent metal cation transporter, partial [Flavisolibacter sp.]|nr:divalent metal cation transporter [Flavisolibacter sp.]